MALDAIVVLESLHCNRETEIIRGTGSEPYIWPAVVRIDDFTLQTDAHIVVIAPALGNARIVIKDAMLAGQTADIPASVGILRTRLEANLFVTRLILIVALWDKDDTPEGAVRAGYLAFLAELKAALGDVTTLLALKNAEDTNDAAARQAIIDGIKSRVRSRVESAIGGALSGVEKVEVATGFLNLDDFLDSTFRAFPNALPTPVNLRFGAGSGNDFEIRGRLEIREVVKDRCQGQVNAVAAAQTAVNDVKKQIESLQAELQHASPQEKPFILSQIKELREVDLVLALEALGKARTALSICRAILPPTRPSEAEGAFGA